MKKRVDHKGAVAVILVVCSVICSGCGVMNDNSAEKDLSLALAGMAGSDAVTFEGSAALLSEGKVVPELSQYYGGKVEQHNRLSLYTLLPDKSPAKAAGTSELKELDKNLRSKQTLYSKLEKRQGKWQELTGTTTDNEDNLLPRLNPLLQLEALEKVDKVVTEEVGAARGTRVLRIELTPAAARRQLSDELEWEMAALRPTAGDYTQLGAMNKPAVNKAMERLWEKKNHELQQKLEQAEVTAVYHLTVDKKRNLPRKLAWKRTVDYGSGSARVDEETFVVQVDFYGYR